MVAEKIKCPNCKRVPVVLHKGDAFTDCICFVCLIYWVTDRSFKGVFHKHKEKYEDLVEKLNVQHGF